MGNGILCDREILALVNSQRPLLSLFQERNLNSFGYDLTLGTEFLIPPGEEHGEGQPYILDPFYPIPFSRYSAYDDRMIIPPRSFVLGQSVERVQMPRDVTGLCVGRSTYARAGLIANVTPLEAGWEGVVTIEIANLGRIPAKLHCGKGIIQVLFFRGETPDRDYTLKGGRYQGQIGVTQGRP